MAYTLDDKGPVDGGAANPKRLSDLRRAKSLGFQLSHLRGVYGRWPAVVDAGFLRLGNALKLALLPQLGFEFGEHAKHVEEAFSGGRVVVVSIGCSVALRAAPLAFTARTMSRRSPMLRANLSILVTVSVSPGRRNSKIVCSSARPVVLVPLRFSERIISQPAAFNAASWISRFWSVVLTRAYPTMVMTASCLVWF
jgi:hypothetical protein